MVWKKQILRSAQNDRGRGWRIAGREVRLIESKANLKDKSNGLDYIGCPAKNCPTVSLVEEG